MITWQRMTPRLFYAWTPYGSFHATVVRCESFWKVYWHTHPSTWPIAYFTIEEAVQAAEGPRPVLGGVAP